MFEILAKKFVKDYKDYKNPEVRSAYGVLSGSVGIVLNVILFGIKIFAGILSSSVAIIADALNNIGDAGSSIIMMVGFKMSSKKPDPEHPFGHGRIEYVTGLVVSMLIIIMGYELARTSITKILSPSGTDLSFVVTIILIVSILVKVYMFCYNMSLSKKLNSAAMKATAMDSISDTIATAVVLVASLIGANYNIPLDGWCGLVVALFILYTGFSSAKDTLVPLLGTKPDPDYVASIEKFVLSHEGILGIHDLIIHDYGPGREMISLHAEVSADGDVLELHDLIDNIERKLNKTLKCHSIIHMDPIVVNDEETDKMRVIAELIAKSVDESVTIHDFRMVKGPTHTNLIFDVLAPFTVELTEDEIFQFIRTKVEELPGNYFAVINVDRPMV